MGNRKKEEIGYTVEREFLGKITIEELMGHIIRAHNQTADLETEQTTQRKEVSL